MIKKSFKEQDAITLVALIITIIVLLILAGVAIATLTGNNGLLTKAGYAKNTSTEAEVLEKLKLAYEDYYLGQHTETGYTFQNALDKMFGTGLAIASGPDSNGIYTVSINGKKYAFNSITGKTEEKKLQAIGTLTKVNYGDYIDLGTSILSDKPADWRILYNDKNGHVYAILADYLPNNNAAVTSSGLHVVDNTTYNVNSTTSRDDLLSKLNSTTAWQSLIPEGLRSTCQVKGATTGEIIMASYNEKYGTNLTYTDNPYFRTNPNDSSSPIDTLYMPHPGSSDYNGCWGYWLASPYADDAYDVWFVYYFGYVNYDAYINAGNGVCPVVSLPSDIQVTKNGTVWIVVQ